MLFLILKWLHILFAILALGSNATYSLWLRHASRHPESLAFALRGIKSIDDRLANRAYAALLGTGILMLLVNRLPLTVPWLLTSLLLYVVLLLTGIFIYAPALRRQVALAESAGPADPAYRQAAQRAARIGILVALVAVAISFLMVVKPALWG
jgi:uncharacterized membrane protein